MSFPLFFSLFQKEQGFRRPPGKQSRRDLSGHKTSPRPSPRAITEPQAWNRAHQSEVTPFCKQWGEGKEGNAFANGADDFLKCEAPLYSENPCSGVPLVGRQVGFAFTLCILSSSAETFRLCGRALRLRIPMRV